MKTKNLMFRVVITISSFLYFSRAEEWSFVFPYYFLFGGIEQSVDQPFVSTCIYLLTTPF